MRVRGLQNNVVNMSRMFRDLDLDGSGTLDFGEWKAGIHGVIGMQLSYDELQMCLTSLTRMATDKSLTRNSCWRSCPPLHRYGVCSSMRSGPNSTPTRQVPSRRPKSTRTLTCSIIHYVCEARSRNKSCSASFLRRLSRQERSRMGPAPENRLKDGDSETVDT